MAMALDASSDDGVGGRVPADRAARRVTPEEDLRGVRALVDAVPEAVLVMEPDGQVRLTNAAADHLFADRPVRNRTDLLSRFEPAAVDVTDVDGRGDALILRQRHRPNRWFTLRTVDLGTSGDAPAAAGDDTPGDRPMVFVLRDITDSRDLRPVREAFLGLVSHELRTPITTIYGLARVLRQRGDALDPDSRRDAIVDIEAESDRLYRLVEDLLVLSRAEGGRLAVESEPINLGRLVNHIVAAERQRHPDREFLSRVASDLPLIEAEATYLEQVVRNFLTNAVKYSRAPERIEIELLAEAGEIVLRVLDRGMGIDDETAEHAFDLFYRTTAASRTASGAGIGLFVCRELIGAMGGRTWIAPRAGGGTEVGFRLPAVAPEAELAGE